MYTYIIKQINRSKSKRNPSILYTMYYGKLCKCLYFFNIYLLNSYKLHCEC